MVEIANHRQALAFLSAIDALTGEVLISRLVQPSERVLHWRTRHSGVTASLMSKAVASGEAVKNWKTARQMLWALVDSETVLIGHSLKHDLQVLGMRHPKIVDSAILTAEAVFPDPLVTGTMTRLWSLKKLAKAFLGADIQVGKNGHAALEDAFASRDIVVQCIRRPAQLEEWAKRMRVEEKDRQIAREIQRKLKAAQKLEGDKKPELGRADRKGTRRKQTKPNLKVVGRAKGLAQT
ncbi:hypothetical protein N7470_000326 [Penicillium chermesinum]|nr:hypothetical protein N7470_000326 [Penicillium chermesinum]